MKFLLLAIVIALFVAWLMRGRIRNGAANVTVSDEHKELLARALDPALVARILFHLSAGNKLAAVAELRRVSGLQEAAAEWLVDAIKKGHRPPPTEQPEGGTSPHVTPRD